MPRVVETGMEQPVQPQPDAKANDRRQHQRQPDGAGLEPPAQDARRPAPPVSLAVRAHPPSWNFWWSARTAFAPSATGTKQVTDPTESVIWTSRTPASWS